MLRRRRLTIILSLTAVCLLIAAAVFVYSRISGTSNDLAVPTSSDVVPFDPYAGLTFDNERHKAWYTRFWTGSCRDVPDLFCLPGDPSWYASVDQMVKLVPAADQDHVQNRLLILGRAVGFEWARDRSIHKISIGDLENWGKQLETSTDIETTIAQIEQDVCTRLKGQPTVESFCPN